MDDDEKKVIEKRSSLRGWKERNRGKPREKKYIIGIATAVLIFSILIIYPYPDRNENVSIPVNDNSSTIVTNPSLINVTPETTAPTPVVTPEITGNIIGKMSTPVLINGLEINITRVDSSILYTNVWIIAKNTEGIEKPFKIGPSTVVMDNIGQQYERLKVERAGISQTNLAARAMRDGAIFFDPLREGRSPKKLILEINGKKAEIMLEK
ncbi:MAG: hypothetical protein SCH70_00570 [Candidatus Methanoperedens sp.]|nr:hypothetical protein [Candidatus Methanoperedens sp.]